MRRVTANSPDRKSLLTAGIGGAAGSRPRLAPGPSQDLAGLTLAQASELLRSKAASATELTQACLKRIEEYDPALNAFITVTGEQALVAARERDAEQARGRWRGPLHGIPVAVKDNMDTAGIRTTAASELFRDRVPTEDAEVVRRLRSAGAVLVGKTNMHEFGCGGSSSVSHFGAVRNPWALDRVPGGSSGGSAAATAAGLCFASLGTDSGGSVRIPASYCGIVGFKPTYGLVSNRGVVPLSWTLDHVGTLCRTVEDTALLLAVVAGLDPLEPGSREARVPDYSRALRRPTTTLRLGVPRAPYFDDLDPDIAKAVETALGVLGELTASLRDVPLSPPDNLVRVIMGAEAGAYHAKWIIDSRTKYQPATHEWLTRFASGVTAQEYAQARRRCDLLRMQVRKAFTEVDLLVMPTVAGPPSTIEPLDQSLDPGRARNAWPFNVLGLPAITVPCGFTTSGLPIGLQIVGAPCAEATVLVLAHAYERAVAGQST